MKKSILFWISAILIFGVILFVTVLNDSRWFGYALVIGAFVLLVLYRRLRPVADSGWKNFAVWLLCIAIAAGGMVFSRPDLNTSFRGTTVRELMRFAFGFVTDKVSMIKTPKEPVWNPPTGYRNTTIPLSHVKIDLLQPENSDGKRIIYQLHGGAYIGKLSNHYRSAAVVYSRKTDGTDVASLDYRTAPEAVFPAALDDAEEGYDFLLAKGYQPENILIAGDSAGGNLALGLTLRLRDAGKPLPAGLILVSPWTDIPGTGESHTTKRYIDPLFGLKKGQTLAPGESLIPLPYMEGADLTNPLLSPVYADFHDFPPLLIQVGSYEVLESDSLTVAEKAQAAGVPVELHVFPGMFHCFQINLWELLPEGKVAWAQIGEFSSRIFSGHAD